MSWQQRMYVFLWISEQTSIISLYITDWSGFYNLGGEGLLCGIIWIFKSDRSSFVLKGLTILTFSTTS